MSEKYTVIFCQRRRGHLNAWKTELDRVPAIGEDIELMWENGDSNLDFEYTVTNVRTTLLLENAPKWNPCKLSENMAIPKREVYHVYLKSKNQSDKEELYRVEE